METLTYSDERWFVWLQLQRVIAITVLDWQLDLAHEIEWGET